MLQLVEPPKNPRFVWSQAILREDGRHSGGRRVVELVGLSKNIKVKVFFLTKLNLSEKLFSMYISYLNY
jgi:hypothetical protein